MATRALNTTWSGAGDVGVMFVDEEVQIKPFPAVRG